MNLSDADFKLRCAQVVDMAELVEYLVRRSIHMSNDGNQLIYTAPNQHRIVPPADEPMIPENYKLVSPKKTPKQGTSPGTAKPTVTDLTADFIATDPNRFKYNQELVPHKPGSMYWAPHADLERYADDEDDTYEILGKRVVGIKQRRAQSVSRNLIRYAPGMQCPFGQIVWVGLHRRKTDWSAVAVVRNEKSKLLPMLKLMWLDSLWGTPWSDTKITAALPDDVEALLKRNSVLIKTADCA